MKPYVIVGTVGGLIGIVFKLFLFFTDRFNFNSLAFSNLMELGIVALVPIFASVYQFKFDYQLLFWERVRPIIGSSIVSTLWFSIFAYAYFGLINPEFGAHFVMENEALIHKNAPDPQQFKKMVDFYLNHFQPINQATSAAFGMMFVGMVFSFISAAISGLIKRS
ncbi:MAG: DUF4199 domain-containing protein [Bacteroidia bacterium]|nr:DUF4199 domain-containing protein [Bacteroidia bacterium]